ncbi:TetR/AcrR family transcriptional regulator [Nocardioides marmoriginsengisoli]|uniref:TetR/AcrR family transcriptional regulator n=1 Tax=Nocardioides marmoriginsengisoli TaxID=661483 RepID=UPI00160C8C9C|nr:TetR/AcrR family transcriptional regulator [Nocardioides marmoriginsengisoli]
MSTTSRGTLRQQQKAATRQLLLDEATRCAAEHGYGAMTVEQVVAGAGVSRATFYLHFSGKSELARAVIDDLRQRSAGLLPPQALHELGRDELVVTARRMIGYYREEIDAFKLWHEASAMEPGLEEAIDATRSLFVGGLLGDTTWPSAAVARRANLVLALMFFQLERICFGWFVSGWPMQEAEVVDEVVRSWEGHYLPRLRELHGG